eukprot:scaffold376006_cov15-Prasinocladus_malaysianus.AAC.2
MFINNTCYAGEYSYAYSCVLDLRKSTFPCCDVSPDKHLHTRQLSRQPAVQATYHQLVLDKK